MTESCSNRIKDIVSKNPDKKYLRLMVDGGGKNNFKKGCSGFQYVFKMDNTINKDDEVIERDNTKLVIDSVSLPFLDQATIDYKETLIKSAFLVVENKNAEMNCSCGTSFSPKQEKKK